jgi:hypothetical protein
VARRDCEPTLGLRPGDACGFVGAVSCATLLCGRVAFLGESPGVLFSEPGAFVKRLGRTAQRRCEAFRAQPVTSSCATNEALALGRLALVRGLLSAILRFLASCSLLEPTDAFALRLLCLSGLLTLVSRALAAVRDIVALVGGPLALVRDPVALVRDPVALVGDPVALIRGVLALVPGPLALVGDPVGRGGISLVTAALTPTTQAVTLALQDRILGRELRLPTPNLRGEALDLGARTVIGRFGRAAA